MLTFDPPELEARLRSAVSKLADFASLTLENVDLVKGFELDDFPDMEVSPETVLGLDLPRCERESLTVTNAIDLVDEASDKRTIFDGLVYHSSIRTVLRVRPEDPRTAAFVEAVGDQGDLCLPMKLAHGSGSVSVGLTAKSLHFALCVVLKDYFYDKYFPPLSEEEFFLEVRHTATCDSDSAMAAAYAYLFELNTSLSLIVSEWPRVAELDDQDYPEDEEIDQLRQRATRLRPLLVGPGMHALFREFNRGSVAPNPEAALFPFVKCIEYVSATVVRERQYEDLRRRLLTPDALNPTAAFMDGLLALFEENRQFTKDFEALRLTVERCCDPLILAKHAPAFLTTLCVVSATSKPSERRQALAELSACLSATRNQLAHAKANYELTGRECPDAQLWSLVACAKLAAEQCIRWYASQNPGLRRA